MDILPNFESYPWCKQNWSYPSITNSNKVLLKQCTDLPESNIIQNIDEIIEKSKQFPIPFPVQTMRLESLKESRPEERLIRNVTSTYTLIHERVLLLMAQFLEHKRLECWEEVGTPEEEPPLTLENCLSYDEMKLSAMVYVSGYTECINNGTRLNKGIVSDNCENEAIIIGLIGPRFHRRGKMDFEDILITKDQNCPENGYGKKESSFFNLFKKESNKQTYTPKHALRQMWSEFYEALTYKDVPSLKPDTKPNDHTDRFRNIIKGKIKCIFDNEVYYKRIRVIAETTLIEAEHRAEGSGKNAFVNIIGCGLGVWMISGHQSDIYMLTFLETISAFLKRDLLNHITDVNFAYIKTEPEIEALFTKSAENPKLKQLFLKSDTHPKGGINVQMENREPSSRLTGEHVGKLLVMTYPWDSNAHPGNEFWYGSLHTSGDPAAACSTQVAELHNAHINGGVSGYNVRVAGRNGLKTLSEYSLALTA